MDKVGKFVTRLKSIGINVELAGNYPWIYMTKVNDIRVTEVFEACHGFTVFYTPFKPGQDFTVTDIKKIFDKIRTLLQDGKDAVNNREENYN